jgi:hypothetical protein
MQEEYQDFIHEILASDRDHKYRKPLSSATYTTRYDEVISFALAEEGK